MKCYILKVFATITSKIFVDFIVHIVPAMLKEFVSRLGPLAAIEVRSFLSHQK